MATGRSKTKPLMVLVVAAIAVAAALWYVRQTRKPRPLVLSGTLEARAVNVGSLVGGRVTQVHVDEGSKVTPGQLLVTLQTDTIDRQIDEQRAAIAAAEAEFREALAGPRAEEIRKVAVVAENDASEARRAAALHRQGIVSREALDDVSTRAKASAADVQLLRRGTRPERIAAQRALVDQQRKRLDSLVEQRGETTVRATVAGTVQSFALRPGDIVAPNQSVAEIIEEKELWVRVYVPETMLGLVQVGQRTTIKVDTFPNALFPGRVSTISTEGEYTPRNVQTRAQRAEQMFGVKVTVAPSGKLKAGMAAEVDLGVQGNDK